jgi:hypothetical protein
MTILEESGKVEPNFLGGTAPTLRPSDPGSDDQRLT